MTSKILLPECLWTIRWDNGQICQELYFTELKAKQVILKTNRWNKRQNIKLFGGKPLKMLVTR